MHEEKKVTGQVAEGEEKTSAGRAGGRKGRGLRVLIMVCCLVCAMTASASATDGGGASGGDLSAITGAFSTVTSLVSTVFSLITGNPLLAVFVAIGLMGSGIGIFKRLKKASH